MSAISFAVGRAPWETGHDVERYISNYTYDPPHRVGNADMSQGRCDRILRDSLGSRNQGEWGVLLYL